jgi:hypothetical protein
MDSKALFFFQSNTSDKAFAVANVTFGFKVSQNDHI